MGIKGHSISPFVATQCSSGWLCLDLLSSAWYIFASFAFPTLANHVVQALKSFCRCMSPIHIQLLFHSLVQIHIRAVG